jgi:hypothetical protein
MSDDDDDDDDGDDNNIKVVYMHKRLTLNEVLRDFLKKRDS